MLVKFIESYNCKNEQEEVDKKAMLEFVKNNDDSLFRTNLIAHFTTSAIILNKDLTKVVFAYHLIYNSWSWVGGHNDGDINFLNVALKEAEEETGLTNLKPLIKEPLMLDNINVYNHIKNGKYVSDHLHLNFTYFLIGDENEKLTIKKDENSNVKWININEMESITSEDRMKYIYNKAYNIILNIKEKGISYYDSTSK